MIETVLQFLGDTAPIVGAVLAVAGAFFTLVGTIGVLRFPDFYTRLHGASVTDTAGASLLIIGMALMAPHWLVATKLAAIWLFLFLTSPTATHAIANAAYVAGLQPRTGPGARSSEDGEAT
ncbi:MAG: monovalent cation/H(+) antiporter subunit G [Pseudomonadota bacterium]